MNALLYVDIDQGKVARNEKRKKLHGFSYTQNIANFEAFRWNISLSANLLFSKSDLGKGIGKFETWLLNAFASERRQRMEEIEGLKKV